MIEKDYSNDIAIIGMSGRFPGAKNINEYWQNLAEGKESVSFFTKEELDEAGVDPSLYNRSNYIPAAPILENADEFDASFFGYTPREAQFMDPQQRLFLELSWTALEDGGYNPASFNGPIGVFGGQAMNTYFIYNGLVNKFATEYIPTLIGNDKDFLSTKVSYKFNLKGPSLTVQTACSSSLVAVHLACQSLLSEESDMALAGGVAIRVPLKTGHLYDEGNILTANGHCRPFDANASGTIFGSGGGIVLLKRLEDAIEYRDNIYAVIKGTAINNDGSSKVGYTAPSVKSQSQVIIEAQAIANVSSENVQYIEAHGTGTLIGDPIEVRALTNAFRINSSENGYCAIGSVKANIGHLDAAAGIAGLIKTAMAISKRKIPPSINYSSPNPEIDFENCPFYINSELSDWKNDNIPLLAGISSLGVGGTNAHIILEETPLLRKSNEANLKQVLFISGESENVLNSATSNLTEFISTNPKVNISDLALTLREGRKVFNKKRIIVSENQENLNEVVRNLDSDQIVDVEVENIERDIVFLFPGSGAQYINMGRNLYNSESSFRSVVDEGLQKGSKLLGKDLKSILFPNKLNEDAANREINQPIISMTTIFIIEYALANYFISLGIKPTAVIGHSFGEYAAACIARIITFDDALYMVSKRSELLQTLPKGTMLAVQLSEEETQKLLNDDLSIAVVNTPSSCVVSGSIENISRFEKKLNSLNTTCRRLKVEVAFHSKMVDPILDKFYKASENIKFNVPNLEFVSPQTGKTLKGLEASKSEYWVGNIRNTVRFVDGIKTLLETPNRIFIEVGPGTALSTVTKQSPFGNENQLIFSSMRHPLESLSDVIVVLKLIGKLHLSGVKIDWSVFDSNKVYRRISLPTYPFERKKHWINKSSMIFTKENDKAKSLKKNKMSDWYYYPSWKKKLNGLQNINNNLDESSKNKWLVFDNKSKLVDELINKIRLSGEEIITVQQCQEYSIQGENAYSINLGNLDNYESLIHDLIKREFIPTNIIHTWSMAESTNLSNEIDDFYNKQNVGFYSLVNLVKALSQQKTSKKIVINLLSNELHDVIGTEELNPAKSTILGAALVIPQEYPNMKVKNIDFEIGLNDNLSEKLVKNVLTECEEFSNDICIAFRGKQKWVQSFEKVFMPDSDIHKSKFRNEGVYLITGGLGNIGYEIAQYLTREYNAKIIIVGRSVLPEKSEWNNYLDNHNSEDEISKKINRLKNIESINGNVTYQHANVDKQSEMENVISIIDSQFGKLNGVIHGAGIVGNEGHSEMTDINKEICTSHFKAKALGLIVLQNILKTKNVDFCISLSSIASMLGGLGESAYVSANIFMDVFSRKYNSDNNTQWLSINWDLWRLDENSSQKINNGKSLSGLGITAEEGLLALENILAQNGIDQIIVSTGDLDTRLDQWVRTSTHKKNSIKKADNETEIINKENIEFDEVENLVKEIWEEALGMNGLKLNDNFTELGGHSLLAVRIISELRETFEIELSVKDLFSLPTIAKLSSKIKDIILSEVE